MKIKRKLWIALSCVLLFSVKASAFTDGSGWVQVAYLLKILEENYRRYQQLQMMIQEAKENKDYLHMINQGLDNVTGIMATLPIKDEHVLGELRGFNQALSSVASIYGEIPQGRNSKMQTLNDSTVAESFEVINSARDYAERQEHNADVIFQQSSTTSPKGAGRVNAQASAQILHTLNQLLKVDGQLLKVKSAELALQNKQSKDSVESYNRVTGDVSSTMSGFSGDFALPRF